MILEPSLAVLDIAAGLQAYLSCHSDLRRHPLCKVWLDAKQLRRGNLTYPWNTAFSCKNLLKSPNSLSIASFMCICRTSVQTVSESDSVAVLSSYAPTEDWNLYLL